MSRFYMTSIVAMVALGCTGETEDKVTDTDTDTVVETDVVDTDVEDTADTDVETDPCVLQTPGTICTIIGTGIAGLGLEDVVGTETHVYLPQDTFVADGMITFPDFNNHRIRQYDMETKLTRTVAGSGLLGDGPEGPALSAAFNHPTDVAITPEGEIIIAAWHNSRIEVVNLGTEDIRFIGGDGERAYGGDGGPFEDSVLDLPSSVTYDDEGNLYITDQANQIIRRVNLDGIIETICGQQRQEGYSGDGGPAIDAQIHASVGQAASPANKLDIGHGMMYIADTGNHVIRVIDMSTMIIDTLAGDTVVGYGGDGGPAREATLNGPRDVASGIDGEVYIADTDNHCIRVVNPDGVVETFAGSCTIPGFEGDGGAPLDALLNQPYGVETDAEGNVYIADSYNHVIRVVYR
jgi:hypothetical protein